MNIFKTKSVAITLLTFGILLTQGTVFAGDIRIETKWILIGNSPLLDSSSKYLSDGYTRAGIRYAKKALTQSQSKYSELIARHNLCIGYHLQGKMTTAAAHCALARSLAMPDASLRKIRSGLYKISHRDQVDENAIKLETVIAQNLQNDDLNRDLPRIAQSQ